VPSTVRPEPVAPITAHADDDAPASRWVATVAPWESGARIVLGGGTARSPLVSTTAQTSVAFDGSLYNRVDLIRQLAAPKDAGNADVVRLAYERWGIDMAKHLKGVFALCIADADNRRLVIARDPLGMYPVFYAEASGRFVVSTSIHALREEPGISRAFNREVIADHISHRWSDSHETFFAAIRRLPPGHMLVSSGGSTSVSRYWDPVPDHGPIEWVPAERVQREFEERFADAVKHAVEGGQVAIFLSGGLDSISVAAMAADVLRRAGSSGPLALSLGFPGQDTEEFEQRAVAKSLGLEHEFVPFYDAAPKRMLEDGALAHMREQPSPLLNPWAPAYANLAQRARQRGVRVILTGSGGDEWLGVSPYLAADLMRNLDVRGLWRFFSSYRRWYNIPTLYTLRNVFWRHGLRPIGSSLLDRAAPNFWTASRTRRTVRGLKPWLAPDPSLRASIVARIGRALVPANPPRGFYFRDIRQMMEHPLVAMSLEEMFEMGRRLGFRYAHPFWDGDVVDILYRTPPQALLTGGRSKGVVRTAMARRFPGLGLDRQKKRLPTTFFDSMVASEVPDLWRRNRDLPTLAGLGIVDPHRVREMADRAIERRDRRDLLGVWYLMNTEAWLATHA
jgi:asparagine synthase (glutamine-hydrolysing)